jgi:hypothetical protein
MSFASLGLHPDLLRTLTQRGHLQPTPIQAAALPAALAGRDLIGAAVTGSGKTLAYVLPILQHLLHTAPETPRPVRALVLVPTRDLALQVSDTFAAYAQALAVRVKVVTVFGGVSVNPQLMALRGGADAARSAEHQRESIQGDCHDRSRTSLQWGVNCARGGCSHVAARVGSPSRPEVGAPGAGLPAVDDTVPFKDLRERWVEAPAAAVTSAHLSPDGDRVVCTIRGRVFVLPVKDGRTVDADRRPGLRAREDRADALARAAVADALGERARRERVRVDRARAALTQRQHPAVR